MYKKFLVALMSGLLVLTPHACGMAGTLDTTTFNPNGAQPGTTAIIIANQMNGSGQAVVVQPDGKIVVAGYSDNGAGSNFAVARFLTDGEPDPSFGTNGTAFTTIANQTTDNQGYGVALQSDGKIVVAGTVTIAGTPNVNQFAIARFDTNGMLDTTFNPTGAQPGTTFTTSVGGYALDNDAYAVAIQPNGQIVLAGSVDTGTGTLFGVARFNADGDPDTTFNGTGSAVTTINNATTDNEAYSVLIQPDGKIVAAGFSQQAGIYEFAIARFNANGILDTTTFNTTGGQPGTAFTPSINGLAASNVGYGAALQSNGQIVVTGYAYDGTGYEFGIARFNADGTLDTTGFNDGGAQPGTNATTVDNQTTTFADYTGAAIQSNGKIIIGGNIANTGGGRNFALARFTSNGILDTTTFNVNGVQPGTVSTTINDDGDDSTNDGTSVALQSNGAIIITGNVATDTGNNIGLARFNGDPVVVTTNPCALALIAAYTSLPG